MLYKICTMLFLKLFCPQMSPFELNDPERFLLLCQKNNFTSHFLNSKENSNKGPRHRSSISPIAEWCS